MEDSVWVVMASTLQFDQSIDKWADSCQIVKRDAWIRVVRSTMESVIKVYKAIDIFVFVFEFCLSLCGAKQLHVLGQISEGFWRCITSLVEGVESDVVELHVLIRARIVREDPWEDRVLREIILGSASEVVERHQV